MVGHDVRSLSPRLMPIALMQGEVVTFHAEYKMLASIRIESFDPHPLRKACSKVTSIKFKIIRFNELDFINEVPCRLATLAEKKIDVRT